MRQFLDCGLYTPGYRCCGVVLFPFGAEVRGKCSGAEHRNKVDMGEASGKKYHFTTGNLLAPRCNFYATRAAMSRGTVLCFRFTPGC